MTGQSLEVYERRFSTLAPQMQDVLPPGLTVQRMNRTVMISLEGNDKLRQCSEVSVIRSAMSLAILGLEADGVSGQGFMLPFAGTAQPCIGYKGYNTIGFRSGIAIRSKLVYEDDEFDIDLGRIDQPIIHKPNLRAGITGRKLLGAWAMMTHRHAPPVPVFLTVAELMQIEQRAPSVKYKAKDSPWFDEAIGKPAMYEKTARRRLSRSTPLSPFLIGATMEEAHEERGLFSSINPEDRVVETHGPVSLTETQGQGDGPELEKMTAANQFPVAVNRDGRNARILHSITDWSAHMEKAIEALAKQPGKLTDFRAYNGPIMNELHTRGFEKEVRAIDALFTKALQS